jgi:nitric oxide dioxygenase
MFPHDLIRQQLNLMDMIAAIVGALDQREMSHSLINQSGRQHAQFGVKASHFAAFGEAMIWSLEQQFGDRLTLELRQAWTALYDNVRDEMMRAAEPQAVAQVSTSGL